MQLLFETGNFSLKSDRVAAFSLVDNLSAASRVFNAGERYDHLPLCIAHVLLAERTAVCSEFQRS